MISATYTYLFVENLIRFAYTTTMDSKGIGNDGDKNNNIEANNSGTTQIKNCSLFEKMKIFFHDFPKLLSMSLLNKKAEINEDSVHQQINEDEKDFLDTNKYNESGPTEMKIDGIRMSKIKTNNGIYILPKAMYEGSGIELKEAAKRIEDGKKVYEKIKNNKPEKGNGFVITETLNKEDVSNLVWFLEYKACCKNNRFMSMFASNMRIPDNDGKIYNAINDCVIKSNGKENPHII